MRYEDEKKLKAAGKKVFFKNIIRKLTLGEELSDEESIQALTFAVLFLDTYVENKSNIGYADIAYFLILKYSLLHDDYQPLYDFSVNFGFYPITEYILKHSLVEKTIDDLIVESNLNDFKNFRGYTETLGQHNVSRHFLSSESKERSYIAPTSFGKSSLIVEYIKKLNNEGRIGIIVPKKSLLMQVYRQVKEADLGYKVIIHDEMYREGEDTFIAVVTQERALRLINRKGVNFDTLIIDEAHNLFDLNRGVLLSRLIEKNRALNPSQIVIYLSPLVQESKNLRTLSAPAIEDFRIKFNLKEPELHEYTNDKSVYKYSRFIDEFFLVGRAAGELEYIKSVAGNKNLVFENTPRKIEASARRLCGSLQKINPTKAITDIKNILAKEVHPKYYVLDYLDYGLIYLHGKLPDLIKEYLESKFNELAEIKYLVANSVLLEGMNLPIDTLFISGSARLNDKDITNLVGRVNRLDQVFLSDGANLNKLLPNIHIVNGVGDANNKRGHNTMFQHLRSRLFEDEIKNPTLSSYDLEADLKRKNKDTRDRHKEKILNIQESERFIYSKVETENEEIRQYFIENNLHDYYYSLDDAVSKFVSIKEQTNVEEKLALESKPMMDKIATFFIQDGQNISDRAFKRLRHKSTQNYYENYYLLSVKQSLNANVVAQVKYFEKKIAERKTLGSTVYIGESFGDTTYTNDENNSAQPVYVELADKNDTQLVNLAIVKLKIEEDFAGFTINKFIQALFDFSLINEDDYNLYIYGTKDKDKIELTKLGLNLSLISKLERDGQLQNLSLDEYNNLTANIEFEEYLNTLDEFQRFEIRRFVN